MFSRFALLFLVSDNEQLVILYGAFFSLISLLQHFVSFDLYTFSSRLLKNKDERLNVIKNHVKAVFILLPFTLFSIFAVVSYFDIVKTSLIVFFVVILILEYLTSDIYRYLLVCSSVIFSSSFFVLKSSFWVFCYCIYYISPFYTSRPEELLIFWSLGLSLILVMSPYFINKTLGSSVVEKKFNRSWFYESIKSSFPILIGTLSVKFVFTVDKILVSSMQDEVYASSYIFFSSIGMSIVTIIEIMVISTGLPKLLNMSKNEAIYCEAKKLISKGLAVAVLASLFLFLTVYYLVGFEKYQNYKGLFYLFPFILASMLLYSLSQVVSVYFYSVKMDKVNYIINFISAVMFILVCSIGDKANMHYFLLFILSIVFLSKITIFARVRKISCEVM